MSIKNKEILNNLLIVIVAMIFLGALYYTYLDLQSKKTVLPVAESSLQIAHMYQIVTQENLEIWPAGTILNEGRAAYFYAAKPELLMTPQIQVIGMNEGKLVGEMVSKVILQAVNDKDLIYWSELVTQTAPVSFELSKMTKDLSGNLIFEDKSINIQVTDAYNRLLQIAEELGFQTGIYRLMVISELHITGVANGLAIDNDVVQQMPVVLRQAIFMLPKSQDIATTILLTPATLQPPLSSQVMVYMSENPLVLIYDGFLLVLLIGVTLKLKKSKVKASIEHRKFKDWITEGTIELKDSMIVKIHTLEGLVDLAIDLDKRVIYDSKTKKYYVMDEALVYIHDAQTKGMLIDNKPQLGKLLLERGLIKAEELETGLYHHQRLGTKLGESLMALGFIDETTLYSALAAQQNLDYFELNAAFEITETTWIDKINLKRARALQVMPMGKRADGKLVVVTSEATNEKVIKELMSIFEEEIFVMATRPSAIYEVLDRLQSNLERTDNELVKNDYSEEQRQQFLTEYIKGRVIFELIEKNIANSELANMLKGLQRAVVEMSWQARRDKRTPDLLQLMKCSNYITDETMVWVQHAMATQELTIEQILQRNHVVGADTIHHATILLERLDQILKV